MIRTIVIARTTNINDFYKKKRKENEQTKQKWIESGRDKLNKQNDKKKKTPIEKSDRPMK